MTNGVPATNPAQRQIAKMVSRSDEQFDLRKAGISPTPEFELTIQWSTRQQDECEHLIQFQPFKLFRFTFL